MNASPSPTADAETTTAAPAATVERICRYPVKGLSADEMPRVELTPAEGLPEDRRFALARPGLPFDPLNPEWLPKTHFLMLMRNERLAQLSCRYDAKTATLEVFRGGKRVTRGALETPAGRAVIEDFFAAFMKLEAGGKPCLVQASGHMFSDAREKLVSIVNLASVRDLARVIGRPVDPLRFRANFYIDGLAPWAEFDWLGQDIAVGGARLTGFKRIVRCAATDVDPEKGVRDMHIPKTLMSAYGHADMGIYATVARAGTVALGDTVGPTG